MAAFEPSQQARSREQCSCPSHPPGLVWEEYPRLQPEQGNRSLEPSLLIAFPGKKFYAVPDFIGQIFVQRGLPHPSIN
jgi:hypothetical protein